MDENSTVFDSRLVGRTAENLFLSLLNQQGIAAGSLDMAAFDGIVFDLRHHFFKTGESPYFVQIKCRGSKHPTYDSQGINSDTIEAMGAAGTKLGIAGRSTYLIVGFYKDNDIRTSRFFGVPFEFLRRFKSGTQYRFSVKRCEEECPNMDSIFGL